MSSQLTVYERPVGLLKSVDQFVDRMRQIQDVAFVLSPFTGLDAVPEHYRISERSVVVDLRPEAKEVYTSSSFCKDGEVAPTKVLLLKLWMAAGGSVKWSHRVDDRKDPYYCEWDSMLTLKQVDGTVVDYPGNKTMDLRDPSPQISHIKDKPKQIANLRARISEFAESMSIERAIRGRLALLQAYRKADLEKKPFVTYALVQDVQDYGNPRIQEMKAAAALGITTEATTQLYGQDRSSEARLVVDTSTGEEIDESDFDLADMPAEAAKTPAAPPGPVCTCPCQHGGMNMPISGEVARKTIEKVGVPRCGPCFPGKAYNYDAHKHLTTLGLTKPYDLTPHQAHQMSAAAKLEAEKGGGGR